MGCADAFAVSRSCWQELEGRRKAATALTLAALVGVGGFSTRGEQRLRAHLRTSRARNICRAIRGSVFRVWGLGARFRRLGMSGFRGFRILA